MIDIKKANMAFDKYVEKYDMSDEMISSKYYHTYRVCEQSIAISKSLNLNEEDTNLAYLIALLHDIGRFEQQKRFGTFNDAKSVDHALLGCNLIFDDGLIREFIDDDSYDEIIKKAVFNHNKLAILDDCSERELLHSKIIRDADKIDIIHNVVNIGHIKLHDDDSVISERVKKSFNNEVLVNKNDKKTNNDSVMIRLGLVFDLNFKYSYEYFRSNDFINKMFAKLKNKDIFRDYIRRLNEYIEKKCNDTKY